MNENYENLITAICGKSREQVKEEDKLWGDAKVIHDTYAREHTQPIAWGKNSKEKWCSFFDEQIERVKDNEEVYNEYKKMFEDLLTYIECVRFDFGKSKTLVKKYEDEIEKLKSKDKETIRKEAEELVEGRIQEVYIDYKATCRKNSDLQYELRHAESTIKNLENTIEEQEKKIKKWQGMYTGKCEVIEQLIKKYEIV